MANVETQKIDSIISSRRAMLAVGGAALAGMAFSAKAEAQAAATLSDFDILNFALNLEYLEAQFYCLAVYGVTIDQGPQKIPLAPNASVGTTGLGAAGSVVTKPNFAPVPFTDTAIAAYAKETAQEEGNHVLFLQKVLGPKAVSMPTIDLFNSFNTLASVATIGPAFDPFAANGNISADASFLLGAYIFEDTGVSAYHGAAGSITDKTNVLPAAVGIHAVEAYHAGLVRTSINRLDGGMGVLNGVTGLISKARTTLGTTGTGTTATSSYDTGIANVTVMLNGTAALNATTIVDADLNPKGGLSIAAGRTPTQILQIVTGNTKAPATGQKYQGVFFPNGLNSQTGILA